MEHPSSLRRYMDVSSPKQWPSGSRPSIKTAVPIPNPSVSSPSDVSGNHFPRFLPFQPFCFAQNLGHASSSHPGHFNMELPEQGSHNFPSDWATLFSAPLDPTVFAALAANGVLGPVGPSSLPTSSFDSHYGPPGSRQLPDIDVMVPPSASGVWTDSPLSYGPPSTFPQRPNPTRSNSSNTNNITSHSSSSSSFHTTQPRPLNNPSQAAGGRHGRHSQPTPQVGMSNFVAHPSPSGYTLPGERSTAGLPPSLWMSPSTNVRTTLDPLSQGPLPAVNIQPSSLSRPPVVHSPVSPTSPTDTKSTLFTDIFSDELFSGTVPSQGTSTFASPRLSGSPDLKAIAALEEDPEQLAKEDPLASKVWKMYAKTKATLPHAQRMENITWRMMAVTLKKKKEEEELKAALDKGKGKTGSSSSHSATTLIGPSAATTNATAGPDIRGRRIDKGKGKVRVVGFDGTNQDDSGALPEEEDE